MFLLTFIEDTSAFKGLIVSSNVAALEFPTLMESWRDVQASQSRCAATEAESPPARASSAADRPDILPVSPATLPR